MIVGRVWAQHFRRASREIRNDRIDWYSASGNHDAGLAGRAKIGCDAAGEERPCQSESSVLFAYRAISADSE